jgi:tetratricopeptide (TPR) repeat protein
VTGLFATVLVAATGVSVWQAVKARDAERRATTEAAIAQAVNDFLQTDLLGQVDRLRQSSDASGGNPDLTVREALDRAAAKIGDRFRDQPLVEAAIRMAIGNGYQTLWANQLAESHLKRAVALRESYLGPDHPETVNSIENLAVVYSWLGRHADAIDLYKRVVESSRKTLGPDHLTTLECERHLGAAYGAAGQWDTSVPLLEQVLEKQRTIFGLTNDSAVRTMAQLAMQYGDVDRLDDSLALYERALECLKAQNAPTEWCLRQCARVYQQAGKLDRADQVLRQSLEELQTVDDSYRRRNSRAAALGWLAVNLSLQHRYQDAEQVAREAVALELIKEDMNSYWKSVLGEALLEQKKYAEAEPWLLDGYEGMKRQDVNRAWERRLLTKAGERVVRFYEETGQPDKAREWQTKITQHAAQVSAADR